MKKMLWSKGDERTLIEATSLPRVIWTVIVYCPIDLRHLLLSFDDMKLEICVPVQMHFSTTT
jgi:hypothetical protein